MKNLIKTGLLLSISSVYLYCAPASYSKCVACHGANGEKKALNNSKILKNMTKKEIEDSLQGYKDGTYGGSQKALMAAQARLLTPQDIKDIANAFGK